MSNAAKRIATGLEALRKACNALPAHQPQPVAWPIFGDAPPPPAPTTASLPPMLAAASEQLARALREPPGLGDQWPFANPPRVQVWIDSEQAPSGAAGGRPAQVKPHQVVQLVRFINLGQSKRAAAERAELKWPTAMRILSGQCAIAHHPAVEAAGVGLPTWQRAPRGPKVVQNPGTAHSSPERGAAAAGGACAPQTPLKSPDLQTAPQTGDEGVPA